MVRWLSMHKTLASRTIICRATATSHVRVPIVPKIVNRFLRPRRRFPSSDLNWELPGQLLMIQKAGLSPLGLAAFLDRFDSLIPFFIRREPRSPADLGRSLGISDAQRD